MSSSLTLPLDRPRAIKWTHGARARLGSLKRVPELGDLASDNDSKGFYALCAFIWAAVVEREGLAEEPDGLADYLGEAAAQLAAWEALRLAFIDAGVLKEKKATGPVAIGSTPGPGQSASSAPDAPTTTS